MAASSSAAAMDSCPRPSSSPLTPAERLGVGDFLPFDRETRMDDTAEFLEHCSLDYGQPAKIAVMPAQHHTTALSQCSGECELDGSYSEFVETQWAKGSGSEGEQESPFGQESVDDVGSDTESVVVSAPLHGPTTVRCVCVCKKRGCKFVKKPFDAQSIRESPISKMPVRYRMVTWLTALRPQRRSDSPAAPQDQMDAGAKVHPEKKSKIVQMFRSRRFRRTVTRAEDEASSPVESIRKHFPGVDGPRKGGEANQGRRCRRCQISVMRSLMVFVGLSLITLGVTYDYGVKHGVDNILQSCWSWLRTTYMNFGDEFVSYNSLFFRMNNNEALYGEPYPKYVANKTKNSSSNGTRFKDAINKVDPKFLFVLEGLKLSVQLNFFSIDENSDMTTPEVLVHDRGPLFFRISFRRTAGLHVEYLPERSNMSLSTPFLIYDLMKMILLTNEFPYFGMHMHDYLQTTPSALFNMIIDNLKKFNVDTTFLSSIQAQIQKGRRKRSPERQEFRVHVPVVPNAGGTEPPVREAGANTVPPVPVTATRSAAEQVVVERQPNASDRTPGLTTTFERLRRSTEEPSRRRSAWKSLSEISRKIFLPLPLDTKKTVLLPVPFIERNLTLRYRHAVNVLGLPGYQFILGNDITKSGIWEHSSHQDLYPSLSYSRVKDGEQDPHIQRHRYNEKRKYQHHRHSKHQNPLESDVYRKSFNDVLGVVDLEPLMLDTIGRVVLMGRHLEHYPFWISPPHFLSLTDHIDKSKFSQESWNNTTGSKAPVVQSDPSTTNLVVGVEGVSANESIHGSFIYYHPILGVPINASLAVQVGVRPPEGMLHAHKLVPIMWTRVQVEEIPLTLWYILWAACHLRESIMVCLISTGTLVVTCGLTCKRKKRLQQRPGSA